MAQVRNILADVKKIDTIETNVGQLQTEVTNFDPLPSQIGQFGKYLTTDGSVASWNAITQYTPPTNQGSGNFLSGDGTYKAVQVPTLLSQLINDSGYQTASQVSTAIAGLVNSAPSTLDTLNELATALGNDPNFATTVTNSIANKLSYTTLADGTGHGFKVGPHLSYYAVQTESTASGVYFNDSFGFIKANYIPVLQWDASKVTIKNSMYTDTITLNGSTGNVTATAFIGNGSQLTNLPQPDLSSYATQTYVNTQVSNLVNAAPAALDTLNELATALGNDANFATTITNSLATKANQSTTYTKTEVDTSLALKANLTDLTPTNVSDKSNTSTGYFSLPKGTTAQRPGSVDAGDTRFNTTASSIEVFTGSAWALVGARDGSSYASAAPSATYIYDLGIRGKGLFWIQKADGTPIQVYCDLDTVGVDGKGGWMLVGSWATASEWTKDSVSSAAVFGTTALNAFSSNFGNTLMNHMRVKVSAAPDTASNVSQADWYYYWGATPIQWKTVWAAGAGTNNHWNSNTAVNNGASTPRNSLRQFSYAYNIKYTYTANYQIWANLSDSGTSGSTGTEAWYDWYSGLTTPGYTLGVYNAGGAGRGDGSLAITFGGDTSTTAGQDCNFANAKYGYDDTALVAWGGDTGVHNMNGQTGTNGSNTNMWIWIK